MFTTVSKTESRTISLGKKQTWIQVHLQFLAFSDCFSSAIRFPSFFFFFFAPLIPEVAPKWCCGSSSPADPEIGVSAPGGSGVGAPATPRAPKSGRVKSMVRLAAELLLLLGLLLLTLHITVLRSNPLPHGNATVSLDQDTTLTEQNTLNARRSSSAQLALADRRSGLEHRTAHQPATLPWVQGSNVHKDGPGAFLLDLHNFPDLSKADINGQNPNIQLPGKRRRRLHVNHTDS
ncbi:hypothetical protein GOODEAATRI_001234 [Goodea atripinnis]|uniref:Uncharacterized protein n=1 Tax=Goodea atripinnis TaxID=208336 RepID=A0ABV0MXQ4_9TELE